MFESLVGYVERGEVRPVVSRTYRLDEIARAQEDFLRKDHIGKLVLVPPPARVSRPPATVRRGDDAPLAGYIAADLATDAGAGPDRFSARATAAAASRG